MKKLISLLLSVILILSFCTTGVFAAEGDSCDCGKTPIIYIIGKTDIYDDPTSPDRQLAINGDDMVIVEETAKKVIPSFIKAVLFNQWEQYYDAFCDALIPLLNGYALSKEGTVDNTSGPLYTWSEDTLQNQHWWWESVWMHNFEYDCRLDPCVIADQINEYVEAVKRISGHSTVNIISRCVGSCMTLAYLDEYVKPNNWEGVETAIWYDPAINGVDTVETLFTGKINLDADALERFASEMLEFSYLNEFLKATIKLFNEAQVIDGVLTMANPLVSKIANNVIPRILRETYGTIPGYWSMVGDENYETAKEYIFGGYEEEYKVLIEKLDNYHYNIGAKADELLLDMKENGKKVAVIGKYGFQLAPITIEPNIQSNKMVSLESQSFGASCSDVNRTFSKEYVEKAKENGTYKYIAPDKQVDASTCLLPDNTWFIKNLEHNLFAGCVDELLLAICRSKGDMTIDSNEKFPQYLWYDIEEETLSPLKENQGNPDESEGNLLKALVNFIKTFIEWIKELILEKIEK